MSLRYRIEERDGGFEPQMRSNMGMLHGEVWFPLLSTGYWADPDAYNKGEIRVRSILTREEAERAILRAQAINAETPYPKSQEE